MDGSDRVNPAGPGQKLTYDDFLLFPDDGKRHELIDGEHYVTPSPVPKHQRIASNLHFFIRLWLEEHPIGRIYFASLDVVLSNFDVVVPDLVYAANPRLDEIATEKNWRGTPNLVIEIASAGTRKRDETIKRELYERSGVEEYWIVDPETEVVRVYRRNAERFNRTRELSNGAGKVLTTPLLPGFELPLSQIFCE
ncbi:MAG TPA: Uma2 family endonuclease [Vicinamibacterales bacterium]|nr:Uma2 family endonuclease [Vicinamibacterales bacterium]